MNPQQSSWHEVWNASPFATVTHFLVLIVVSTGAAFIIYEAGLTQIQSETLFAASATAGGEVAMGHRPHLQYAPGRIIIQFKAGVSQAKQDALLKKEGHKILSTITPIRAHVLSVPVGAEERVRDAFARNPLINYAELDGEVDASFVPNDPYYSSVWGLSLISASQGWDFSPGAPGVTIAVLDSGIDSTHADLAPHMVPGYNFLKKSSDTSPDGVCHHGTAVAGTAGAVGNNALGTIGVAWSSNIMPLVIADYSVTGTCTGYWSAIASAVTYAADHGVRIVNISYGGSTTSTTMENAVAYAWGKGTVVFASSGNSAGSGNPPQYPAASPYTVAVGAVDPNSVKTSYSSYGSYLDLVAPGTYKTTDEMGAPGYTTADYINMSGTSFASPIVAGVAAHLLAVNPKLTASQLVDILEQTATDLGDPGRDDYYGWGEANLSKAILAASTTLAYADTLPPTATISITSRSPIFDASYVSGVTNISVTAKDNIAVAKVELYKDGSLYASDSIGPYNFALDTTQDTDGSSHTLYVKAYDTSGNSTQSASKTVMVDNAPPNIQLITSPPDGAVVSGTVSLSASASDAISATVIYWFVDGMRICTTASCAWDSTSMADGVHSITATAYDRASNPTSVTVAVTTQNGNVDTTPPTVTITSPQNGITVADTVTVNMTWSDVGGVQKIDLYKDNGIVATFTASPYTWYWDTTKDADGTHVLLAKAYDVAGNMGQSSVTVTVGNSTQDVTPPTVTITAPSNGAVVLDTVVVSASFTDASGIAKAELYKDGVLQGSLTTAPYMWNWDTTKDTNGTHTLVVKGYDTKGNVGQSSISVIVANPDTVPPTVSITAPSNGSRMRGASTKIAVSASDASGLASIQIYADDALLSTCNNTTACSTTWSIKSVASGTHTISAKATDKAGNTAVANISVVK